jgi:hypothetical protein
MDLLRAAREEAFKPVMSGDTVWEAWLEVLGRAAGGERAVLH